MSLGNWRVPKPVRSSRHTDVLMQSKDKILDLWEIFLSCVFRNNFQASSTIPKHFIELFSDDSSLKCSWNRFLRRSASLLAFVFIQFLSDLVTTSWTPSSLSIAVPHASSSHPYHVSLHRASDVGLAPSTERNVLVAHYCCSHLFN